MGGACVVGAHWKRFAEALPMGVNGVWCHGGIGEASIFLD